MSDPDDAHDEALHRLDKRLEAFEGKRSKGRTPGDANAVATAYRIAAGLIGGVLSGVGFGWLLDRFAGTAPWGVVGGLLIGLTASTVSTVRHAARLAEKTARDNPAPPAAPADDEDE